MVKQILTESGFTENKTFKETRFLTPPKSTYAIFTDSYSRRGADNLNMIKDHSYVIELYEYKPDPSSEAKIEATFDKYAIQYDKQNRYWLESESLYQVVYSFDFTEK